MQVNLFIKVGHKTTSKPNKWDHFIGTVAGPIPGNGLATKQSFNLIGSFSLLALWTKLKCDNHLRRKFLKEKQTNDWITFFIDIN